MSINSKVPKGTKKYLNYLHGKRKMWIQKITIIKKKNGIFITTIILRSDGNGTEWSPIRSVIIRVITKSDDRAAGVRFVYHESYYQSIIKITNSEKRRMARL